ncbi:MAG TPA: sigma-70 family RNA polymerase sigma factor [Actinomycetota bacterium]|nr:sigma-70 family RNA polymerase sigma factor [Actinomycetota bacterium]
MGELRRRGSPRLIPIDAPDGDLALVEALRAGDEAAFLTLVERYQPVMLRIARMYVPSRAVAEEVVQEAWVGVLKGLAGFEGRSSLRTWILRIVTNVAKTRGVRESRSTPFSSVWSAEGDEPVVELERFLSREHADPGAWAVAPAAWETVPEERLISRETLATIGEAIAALPPNQREVIRLRDVLGWTSQEVCNALDIGETNQRVLLHRARGKVRRALERTLDPEAAS